MLDDITATCHAATWSLWHWSIVRRRLVEREYHNNRKIKFSFKRIRLINKSYIINDKNDKGSLNILQPSRKDVQTIHAYLSYNTYSHATWHLVRCSWPILLNGGFLATGITPAAKPWRWYLSEHQALILQCDENK